MSEFLNGSNWQAMVAAIAVAQPKTRYDDKCGFYDRRGEIVERNIDRALDRLLARPMPVGDPAAIFALASWYR